MGVSEEDRAGLFSVVSSERRGGNGHKLKCRKFHVVVGVTKPRGTVESPSLEILTNVTGQGLEQPARVDFALSREVGLDNVPRCLPTSAVL